MMDYNSILKKVNSILSEDRFASANGHKVSFDDYCKLKDFERKHKGDEDILVTPILLEILKLFDFKSGINILQQVSQDGDKPDFRTTETNKFILDAKSTGTDIITDGDSKSAAKQIQRYLLSFKGYQYGILFNLQRFEFFERRTENDLIRIKRLEGRSINLVKLLHDFTANCHEETKDYVNFKWFYENFRFAEIKPEEYIETIKNRHKEDLIAPDKKFLKKLVYGLVDKIQENIRRQVLPMSKDLVHHIQLKYELDKLIREINVSEEDDKYAIAAEELVKQISYVILLRFILIRIFEDNSLIPLNLYDGGFKRKLEPPFSMTFKEILFDARVKAGELFSYFEDKFPYNFQITKDDDLLIRVLFELSKINFSEINFDLIGDLYEHYLNEDERKEKGQFYTPHYIVEFILNRVGFLGKLKDQPNNKTLLDPSCGSGSFLVEAAIRLRKEGMNRETAAKRAIVDNLHGSELTGFASRLAELNLVIQALSLVKRIENEDERQTQSFRVCTTDSLMKLYNHDEFEGADKVAFDTSEFTSTFKDVFIHLMANKNDFDFVVGNPPYVGEKGHKEMFRPLLAHSYWKHFYQGKSDYLYYFIILGLSKLAEGGKLGFITTQYWLTADGAGKLRNYILQHAKIFEIVDFKGIKLFPEAQGQENIVFILQKCSIESERESNRIKIVQFYKEWINSDKNYVDAQNRVITNWDRFIELLTNASQFELFADPDRLNFELGKDKRSEIADVYYSGTIQGELDENAWYLYSREKPIMLEGNFAFLTDLFNVNQGIVSGADRVTNENIKKIPRPAQDSFGIKPGDPIFIFDKDQLAELHLTGPEMKYVKPFYKNSDIHRGVVDVDEFQFVLYNNDCPEETEIPGIVTYLQRFRGILDPRREVESGSIRWYDLWWPRDRNIFESEKLVTSRRAKENTFGYENLRTYPQSDITLITPKEGTKENLKYLFALLNSDYLNTWYGRNAKMKGNMREYYFTPLSKVPIRKIDFGHPDEAFIHDILGGCYSSNENGDPEYLFDEITQTYIRQKGLADYYISLKSELYRLRKTGFEFDPEKEVANPDSIKVDLFSLADFLCENHPSQVKFVRDVMLFYPALIKDPTLYSFNSAEKTEVKSFLSNCTWFIKSTTKDVQIKGVKTDRIESLFNDTGDFGNYGFECSIDLISNDNKIIEVDCKTQADAGYLAGLVQSYLKKSKLLSWEALMSFPVNSEEMELFVREKRAIIFNALSPLNEKLKNRLDQIFQNREVEPIAKINNINCLQHLINRYVSYLYKGT